MLDFAFPTCALIVFRPEKFHDVFHNAVAAKSLENVLESGGVTSFVASLRKSYIVSIDKEEIMWELRWLEVSVV